MKKNRIISLFLSASVLFSASCQADPAPAEIEAAATNTQADKTEITDKTEKTAIPIANTLSEKTETEALTEETEPTEENFYPMRAGEGKRVFEEGKKYLDFSVDGVSYDYELLNKPEETEDPTLAEQLYRALYDFAVFFQVTDPYRLQYLTDQGDTVKVEGFSIGGLPVKPEIDKDYVRTCEHIFRRVKYGEVTTLGEYFSRLLQTASPAFLHSDANLFEKQFVLSNGNLYLTSEPDAYTYIKSSADTRLNGIRKILSAASGETMELSFTASYEMYDLSYTEDYIVTLSYDEDYGWRVDDCSSQYAVGYLVSEILEGGKDHKSPKTDLLEEIELWLGQIGLM